MSNTQSQDTKQQEASQQPQQQKPTVLEEDDEFEDFPVDGGFPTALLLRLFVPFLQPPRRQRHVLCKYFISTNY
jgi:hypothetical protein